MEGIDGLDCVSLWGMGSLIATQMAVRAAVELDVFNIISEAGYGAQLSAAEIVSKIPTTNPNAATALDRILRLLSANSFLSTSLRPCKSPQPDDQATKPPQERTYGLTLRSQALVSNKNELTFAPLMLATSEKAFVEAFYKLKDVVLEPAGCVPFEKAHGVSLFQHLAKDPNLSSRFNAGMGCGSRFFFHKVFKVYKGFEDVKELMDVGGGNGTSLGKIVSVYPHIRGINFDLPYVTANALQFPGVKNVGGNMFESVPNAQTIMLKKVLHDWNDELCIVALKNCWKALPDNGKVIVVESIIPEALENTAESLDVIIADINMMLVTPGGKERTAAEFEHLAKESGFAETKIFPIIQGFHVLEFIKKSAI